jgi:hypothetical protein
MILAREAFLFRLECDPPAYLWSGVGDLVVPADNLVPTTDTYLGGGELLAGLPEIQQLINGTASRVEFTASGVDQETIRLALEDRASVDGATVRIGTVPMDENWAISGSVDWEWEGIADVVTIDRSGDENGAVTRSVTLSVGSADTTRSRYQLTFFTDADQRRRSPTDAFFSHVGGITQGSSRRFGGSN